ncbi:MAG TPA: hypothetical protein VN976_04065 [Verrucomicrobiae bacterium]|nr:hypothetical protein [Verrucomicrobiae bacterium]
MARESTAFKRWRLNGAIDAIEKWAKDAANQGRGRPPRQGAPAATGGGFAAWKK